MKTPIGRKLRPKLLSRGQPLVRVKPKDLDSAGVQRVPRTVGVQDGLPVLEGGRVLKATNVIWCTGYHPGFSWIDLPIFGELGPLQERGIAASQPGLYFVGLSFQFAASSSMIHGVGRDAEFVARAIQERRERLSKSAGEEVLHQRQVLAQVSDSTQVQTD